MYGNLNYLRHFLKQIKDLVELNKLKKLNIKQIMNSSIVDSFDSSIVDSFVFYNETELLDYRLNLLKDFVDYFVVVEATHTFTGKPKQLYFDQEKYKTFNIIYILVDDMQYIDNPTNDQIWTNEKHQRNCISRGISKLELKCKDYILISDVDEIPDPKILQLLKNKNFETQVGELEQSFYYYNLNTRHRNKWYLSKIIQYNFYLSINLQPSEIRLKSWPRISNGGWHLSYFGNSNFIKNKIQNFSHQEYNNEDVLNNIKNNVEKGCDLFNRPWEQFEHVEFKNNDYLPPNYENIKLQNI